MDGMDQVFKIDRLLPQTVDARHGQCLAHADIGGSGVVASDARLRVVIAIITMRCQQAVADIALGNIDDNPAG